MLDRQTDRQTDKEIQVKKTCLVEVTISVCGKKILHVT